MLNEELHNEKEELIEMMGIHLQSLHSISQLCGKIWATLIIEGKSTGLTFDYLLQKLQVSKSSVSTNLNFLLETDRICFSIKEGERKKYFKAHPFSKMLERIFNNLKFEKKLVDKIIDYRRKEDSIPENIKLLENLEAYKSHIVDIEKSTLKIIEDLKRIEHKNTNK